MQEIIERDYNTFSGLMLERYSHRVAMESGEFTRIGRWWDRKGENEISIGTLKQKAEAMLRATGAFKGYEIRYEGLSMEDM